MNKASRLAATISSQASAFHIRACFFHCTPVLGRGHKRRTQWESASPFKSSKAKHSGYNTRLRKQSLLRDAKELAERVYQRWQSDTDEYDPYVGRESSWFRSGFREDGSKKGKSKNRKPRAFKRDFEFCDDENDDVEFETIPFSIWQNPRASSGWKYRYDEEYDSSSDYEKPSMDMCSDRLALGLGASGPLNLDDVKNAYRVCALKWHPDRHQGSSKAVAEEKFKCLHIFHSTPFLCLKKRVYWPERSYRRGPPRLKYDFVFERFQVSFIDELNYHFPTTNPNSGEPHKKTEYSSKSFEEALPSTRKCDRLALGLHAAGPLTLQYVKTAYRSCALKWHPDHHQPSSKAFVEEKFKKCTAAYQSLCDQLSSS